MKLYELLIKDDTILYNTKTKISISNKVTLYFFDNKEKSFQVKNYYIDDDSRIHINILLDNNTYYKIKNGENDFFDISLNLIIDGQINSNWIEI